MDLGELLEAWIPDDPQRVIIGTATAANTVLLPGETTAVELPAVLPVVAGQKVAVVVGEKSRLILGPVDADGQLVDGDLTVTGDASIGGDLTLGGAKITGWRALGTGTGSGTSITIPVPVVCSILRLSLLGDLDGPGFPALRVNGDTTANLHRWSITSWDGNGDKATGVWSNGTVWRVGEWTNAQSCTAEVLISGADGSTAAGFQARSTGIGGSAAAHRQSLAGGRLAAAHAITSLIVFPIGATNIDALHWTLEGYIP